jgi:aspartyl aminopeptidase
MRSSVRRYCAAVLVLWIQAATTTNSVTKPKKIAALIVSGLAAAVSMPTRSSRTTETTTAQHWPLAQKAMQYFDSSTDPFHAVQTSIEMLLKAGFVALNDDNDDDDDAVAAVIIQPGGKYFFTRNRSTLVAFAVGSQFGRSDSDSDSSSSSSNGGGGGGGRRVVASSGFKIIGGHTDSPNLRVKPRSKRTSSATGCIQLGVECYGGGLWHTWFDRDLGISGRVLVRVADESGRIEQRLVQIDRALLRISNLAIHLQTEDERKAFKFNKEDHLSPLLALEATKALTGNSNENDKAAMTNPTKDGWSEYQEPALLELLATELDTDVANIVDFELNLFDVQKATLSGAYSEFVCSARLDNLASCFMAVQALVEHVESGKAQVDSDVSMVVLYDHEEVGSNSAVGAASPILSESVRRIALALAKSNGGGGDVGSPDSIYNRFVRHSFVLSSDQAHAVHPNYVSKHEQNHQPKMNQGMVIKRNSNQRYATTPLTGVIIREIARRAGLPPVQEFMVRQDCGCGSTIGPVISAATGIRTIDMGCPQLSMHSIRETMGVCDLSNGLALFKAFFEHFRAVDSSIEDN